MTRMRLQKFLALAGLGSRRACEELIQNGRVAVDGATVTRLGTTVDPETQTIACDGTRLKAPKMYYFLLNKPAGYICSARPDRTGRPLVADLLKVPGVRLFSVGRLDVDSKGAILLTNDGDFANRVSHPRYDIAKTYRVRVQGAVSRETLEQLRRGVWLAEGRVSPTEAAVIRETRRDTLLRIVLREGRNREIRRILARLELRVTELERTRIGTIALGRLKPGEARPLKEVEVRRLLAGGTPRRKPSAPAKRTPRKRKAGAAPARGTASRPPRAKAPRTARKAGARSAAARGRRRRGKG